MSNDNVSETVKSEDIHYYKVCFASPNTAYEATLNEAVDYYEVGMRGLKKPSPEEAKIFLHEFFEGKFPLPEDWVCINVKECDKQELVQWYTDSHTEAEVDGWTLFTGKEKTNSFDEQQEVAESDEEEKDAEYIKYEDYFNHCSDKDIVSFAIQGVIEDEDFDLVNDGKVFKLQDCQMADLSGIEGEEFSNLAQVIDRLDMYHDDYIRDNNEAKKGQAFLANDHVTEVLKRVTPKNINEILNANKSFDSADKDCLENLPDELKERLQKTHFKADFDIKPEEINAYLSYVTEQVVKGLIPATITDITAKLADDGKNVELDWNVKPMKFQRIRRITGYLVGDVDRWNNAKQAELKDRVSHVSNKNSFVK